MDPYLQPNGTLKNKLNISDTKQLDEVEHFYTTLNIATVQTVSAKNSTYDFEQLKAIHKHIFGDIYDWAGQPRTVNIYKEEQVLNGLSVEYSDHSRISTDIQAALQSLHDIPFDSLSRIDQADRLAQATANLWKCHPFREGNTRTIIAFIDQFLASKNRSLDTHLLSANAAYVRNALVMASLGEYAEPGYLQKIFRDALQENRQSIKSQVENIFTTPSRYTNKETKNIKSDR